MLNGNLEEEVGHGNLVGLEIQSHLPLGNKFWGKTQNHSWSLYGVCHQVTEMVTWVTHIVIPGTIEMKGLGSFICLFNPFTSFCLYDDEDHIHLSKLYELVSAGFLSFLTFTSSSIFVWQEARRNSHCKAYPIAPLIDIT